MDMLDFSEYMIPSIMMICFIVGVLLKQIETINKRFIPHILTLLGITLSIWIGKSVEFEVVLKGVVSGFASSGLWESIKNTKRDV